MAQNIPTRLNRLRGVQHPPEADIQNIRDLLRGYGSEASLIKELIQNAEDAGARNLDLILLPGDKQAAHPLLHSPGLCAINDGLFEPKHLEAIFRLGLGTKGTDPRAIGRFGKGLKSVFALCEAFFVVARTDIHAGWNRGEVCEFFNPWNAWRHGDWNDAFDNDSGAILTHVLRGVAEFSAEHPHWLSFWMPLRHPLHCNDQEGPVPWIYEGSGELLPGEDGRLGAKLITEFRSLAPTLVTLRSLEKIRLINLSETDRTETTWSLLEGSTRCPEPGGIKEPGYLSGSMVLGSSAAPIELRYTGYAGTLPEFYVVETKAKQGWPTIVEILSATRSSADQKAKGEPHYATILTAETSSSGKLDVRWSVFFPVSEQPDGESVVPLPSLKTTVTLNLHGFFFLDTERRRVDGLQQHFTNADHACLNWNEIVAKRGTLAHVPKAFAGFANRENLTAEHCEELASAFTQTWVWSKFSSDICRQDTWRPRWRAGTETWECIPAEMPALPIPAAYNHREIDAVIPSLKSISEKQVLVVRSALGTLRGLHLSKWSIWPEQLSLQLLNGVVLDSVQAEEAAIWITQFLEILHDDRSFTPAIMERVYSLPLLLVTDARTKSSRRVSVAEWTTLSERNQLFTSTFDGNDWFPLLGPALPEWSCCVVSRTTVPRWFNRPLPLVCDGISSALVVLTQSNLGPFPCRAKLVQALAPLVSARSEVKEAMRFLMHGSAPHSRDGTSLLFMPSAQPGQLVWSRLIEQLLENEGGENSWRHLDSFWSEGLSSQVQRELGISTIDEEASWWELMNGQIDYSKLLFPQDHWSDLDISTLLQGLFRAGNLRQDETLKALRKLRLHTLRGQSTEKVAVADANGQLDTLFVLNRPDFENTIPANLRPLWERFLSGTKIVVRLPDDNLALAVQEKIFQRADKDGAIYAAALDWNYVVRRCLEWPSPFEFAPLILEAISKYGDQAVTGVGSKLKTTEWIPLALGGSIAPDSVLLIEGLEEELDRLLDPEKDGLAGARAIPEWVNKHAGFATLRKYFPSLKEALELLELWLTEKPEWQLGLVESSLPEDLDSLLSSLEGLEDLRGASLLAKLRRLGSQKDNTEWVPLLRDTIWKSLLKRFEYRQDGVNRIGRILVSLARSRSRVAFDTYLRQAVADSVLIGLLPQLSLVNMQGQWMPANRLIWPSVSLDTAAQLCAEQAAILSPIHIAATSDEPEGGAGNLSQTPKRRNQLEKEPHFDAQAAILGKYLEPFRNGNVSDILPAALVSVLGNNPKMLALQEELLESSIGVQSWNFGLLLLGENRQRLIDETLVERFLIEIVHEGSTNAATITGDTIAVELSKDVTTLLVGDPSSLSCHYFFQNRQPTACHILRLRSVAKPDELSDPVSVFATTVETILRYAHCKGDAALCPHDLKGVLGELANATQTDLRRSRLYLLDMAEARLKELAVKGVPQFDKILDQFAEARNARIDADYLATHAPIRAGRRRETAAALVAEARRELTSLLESPRETALRRMLVQAVRRKMTDFQYGLGSVALELFQNADDAVAELDEMKNALQPVERQFVIHLDVEHRRLEIVHWGRPINRHTFPGFQHGLLRGYDQDLQKMLTLNFSDKGVTECGQAPAVTGRFGLGFKTVFFVSDQPEVISGRLALEIRGGFYPVPLPPERAKGLRQWADTHGSPGLAPTAIRLHWSEETKAEALSRAFDDFARIAPLLTIFSRRMQTLILAGAGPATIITKDEKALTFGDSLTRISVGRAAFLCFHCRIREDQRPASVLFQLDASGITHLKDIFPPLWITTPTAEHSDFRWAVNAPFKPDAGRQRLALNNPANRKIAENVARAWGDALVELFDETIGHWDVFSKKLNLNSSASFDHWWLQFWGEVTRSAPALHWEDLRDGGQVLGLIAWGKSVGAVRRLLSERAAIPSKLLGSYAKMVNGGNVRFSVTGLLADTDNGCFAHIAEWASVQAAFSPEKTVRQDVAVFLKQADCVDGQLDEVSLQHALAVELGPRREVNHPAGDRIGKMLTACGPVFEASSAYSHEVQVMWAKLTPARFLADDGSYQLDTNLVCAQPIEDLIEKDEILRSAFAPRSALFSKGYSASALRFFVKARGKLKANAVTLAGWVRSSQTTQLPAIFGYLLKGELAQGLANELKRPWLDAVRTTTDFRNLSAMDQSELERIFFRGQIWTQPILPVHPLEADIPIAQVMPADVAFRLVSEWWQREQNLWISRFEEKTYPAGFPGELPWAGDDEWDATTQPSAQARWLMLFIHAALVPLGFNKIGRDQSFTRFLISKNWLEVFTRVSDEPEALINALDEYLNASIQNTQFHFAMRQFVPFYAVARNLESLLYSLRAAEESTHPGSFNLVFSPKANPSLTGTGIEAPPLSGMLGMGTCQLLRELYRVGRLTNPHGFQFAFTPIRKVRRLCAQLFGTPEGSAGASTSRVIFSDLEKMGKTLGLDPTFNHCFDLPLQILAENRDLRTAVLHADFLAEEGDSPELDAAPRDFKL